MKRSISTSFADQSGFLTIKPIRVEPASGPSSLTLFITPPKFSSAGLSSLVKAYPAPASDVG